MYEINETWKLVSDRHRNVANKNNQNDSSRNFHFKVYHTVVFIPIEEELKILDRF